MEFPLFQVVPIASCPVKKSLVTSSLLSPPVIYEHESDSPKPSRAPD